MARRRTALEKVMGEAEADHLILFGAERSGSAVVWITGWPVTREAAVVFSPGKRDVLLVQHYNHVPNARRLAPDAEVRWGGVSTIASVLDILEGLHAETARIGVIGPLDHKSHAALTRCASEVVDLNAAYTSLRLVKSQEEVAWLREGAAMSDAAITALVNDARVGHSEGELVAMIEAAYLPLGGTTHIHYVGVTSMKDPDRCVPSQYPSSRVLEEGDAVTVEISASYWGYAGQVLRTFTVSSQPSGLYKRLHDTAELAFDAVAGVIRPGAHVREVLEAAGVIEEAGFTIYDDLLHGFGGGYLPPVVGTKSRSVHPVPDMTFEAGMTVVIQPNVITPDERAGVQTGELVLVSDGGISRLHHAPRGLLEMGAAS
jgi:Xaa-Pro dipeptidase